MDCYSFVSPWSAGGNRTAVGQHGLEAMLAGRARSLGIEVRRECDVTTFVQQGDGIDGEWPTTLPFVIPRACDFFDLFVFSAYPTSCISSPRQSRHPERSASKIYRKQRALWRGVEEPVPSVAEGTPAMHIGRCSWELSGRKLRRKIKKSQTPSEADLSRRAVEGSALA